MQPIARAGSRLVLEQLRFASTAVLRGGNTLPVPKVRQSRICPQCSVRAFQAPMRLYSTPPKPPNSPLDQPSTEQPKTIANDHSAEDASLPSAVDSRRSAVNQRLSQVMDTLQTRLLTASQTLNDITGYTAIDRIKATNTLLETQLADSHARVRAARALYKSSNSKRAATQREVTTLLARKESWSPADLERFTELYRQDHVLEGEVHSAAEALTEAEGEEQSLGQRLNQGMLRRYHEEQIWSDRIRRASTWGTWGLMGVNVLLFMVLQFVAEPWKRKRLVKGVVEEEKLVLEGVRGELGALREALERQGLNEDRIQEPVVREAVLTAPEVLKLEGPTRSWKEFLSDPGLWRESVADLYSERTIDIRMRDASIIALEGIAAGATIAGGIALLMLRRT